MTPQRFGLDLMTEGQVLVRGTCDPMEALRVYVDRMDEVDDSRLYGVAPDCGEFDPEAVEEMAHHLYSMLVHAQPALYRKIHCLPGMFGSGENWSWELWESRSRGPGVFEGVCFP